MRRITPPVPESHPVSMESGLEDRNNVDAFKRRYKELREVSMESGLEDRNNVTHRRSPPAATQSRLNGVRPRRPEQL